MMRAANLGIRRTVVGLAAAVAVLLIGSAPAQAQCSLCPEDIAGDSTIGVPDLLELLSDWGTSNTPSDFDGDGAVGVSDLLQLLSAWGPCEFTFETFPQSSEAVQIAMEMLGPDGALLPEADTVQRVQQDLDAIRDEVPELETETHTPAWVSNEMIVSLEDNPSDEALAELDCYNDFYQVINIDKLFGTTFVYTLAGDANIEALSQIYSGLDATSFAEPNGLIGGQNFWEPMPQGDGTWIWEVDDGFMDCFDGCDCHNIYTIETTPEGDVEIIDFVQQGQPWCPF